MEEAKRFKLISCEVFYREMCWVVARSPNVVDLYFLPKGLHDIGAVPMRDRVQAAIDAVDKHRYDAVLLGYGLCNNGLAGVCARGLPLVLPRAHDCITLFLGSKERYLEYFNANPGVYFKTSGWIERGENPGELSQLSIQRQTGMDKTFDELVAKYGEENARYLWDTLVNTTRNYSCFTYIEMGVEGDDRYEQWTREEARQRGWAFQKLRGDLSLIERLVNGPWSPSEFLVVPPGRRIGARYDEAIVDIDEAPNA
ncbi:MAG: DUF1638 domain-containing protein [Chthonomonadales bacterium]